MAKQLVNPDNTPQEPVYVEAPVLDTGRRDAPLPPPGSGLSTQAAPELDEVIQNIVAQKVAEALALNLNKGGSQEVEFAQKVDQGNAPDSFLKHYRSDLNPNLVVQEVDMARVKGGESRGAAAIKGNWLRFDRGHFYATTQNQVDQLDWMMNNPQADPRFPDQTVGGNPSIYEHDGGDIYRCPVAGCEFISASKNGIRAHRRATHGEAI